MGDVFRIDTFTTRIQTTKSGNRQVKTPVQVKDGTASVTISLSPATDCAPPVNPDPIVPVVTPASFEFTTSQLSAGTVGTNYSQKIGFKYHTTSTNYATNVSFTGLPAGLAVGNSSHPNEVIGVLPGIDGPDGQASVVLSGVPTTAGTYSVTMAVTDQHGTNATKSYQFTIAPRPEAPPQAPGQIRTPRVGQLITKTDGVAYLVGDNGLVGIPSMAVFNSWCFSISDLVPANVAENALSQVSVLETRAAGQALPAGVSVLKVTTCPVTVTPPVTVTARTGQLINRDGTVLLVGDRGVIGIPSLTIFNSWCFSFGQVVEANSAERAMTQVGLLEMRAAGQTLPAGVSVLKVATCSNTPPPVVENRAPVSAVDIADCDQNLIKGWAADPDTLHTASTVRLIDNSVVVRSEATSIVRDDVNSVLASQYNGGQAVTGAHGFSFDLSSIRSDGKIHLFALEVVDNTGALVKVNLGSSANMVCQAVVNANASIQASYSQIVLLDKNDNSVVLTDTTGRDDTTITYKEDTVAVGDVITVCPGPDGQPGRKKNVAISAWVSPNGGAIFVKDSISGQEKWFAQLVGPTPQSNMWTASLGAGNVPVTYTFRLSSYYSGANTVATKTIVVRPITGACDPGEYSMKINTDGVTYCPRNNQYTRVYAYAVADNVNNQPAIVESDGIYVKFRPYGLADIPSNYQVLPVQNKRPNATSDPHMFGFESVPFSMNAKGTYLFFLRLRGKTIYSVSKQEFVGLPTAFCE